jgi:hypothetical protein
MNPIGVYFTELYRFSVNIFKNYAISLKNETVNRNFSMFNVSNDREKIFLSNDISHNVIKFHYFFKQQ